MNEDDLKDMLAAEGFKNIFVHTDTSGAYYPDHTHPCITAHVVLEGEITINVKGTSRVFTKGERFDVDAGEFHSAKVGPTGCTYMIGEK